MIFGYVDKNKICYETDKKVFENDKYFLVIDGYVDDNYYNKVIDMYEKDKYDFINNLNNYISIYLFDKKNKELLLINDHIGSKKIYYYVLDNKIYFSNDLRNFKKKNKSINVEVLSMYFRHHFIPEPYTIYNDIYKLEHGYYLVYKDNKISKNKYFDVIDKFNNRKSEKNYEEIENKLETLLINQLDELTRNKKNIGIYLSSGVDSNLAFSLYSKISKKKINTFTVGFESKRYNEAEASKKIAKYLKSNHHELILKNDEALGYVKKIPDYFCEPFGDPSVVATIILNEFAHKNNIEFAITGDGSDQLFCGAREYDRMYKLRNVFHNPFRIKANKFLLKNRKLFYIFAKIPKEYRCQVDVIYKENNIDGLFIDNGPKRFDYENKINTKNIQEKRMILDLNTFMAERVFQKMCIAANKNNISVLSLYLTKDMIEYSFNIPHKFKYHNKVKKYILRKILYKTIPEEFFDKIKKGFAIPTVDWLKTSLNSDLKRLSTKEYLKKQNIFNYEKVQYLIEHIAENANLVWDYYVFQLWYEKNFK